MYLKKLRKPRAGYVAIVGRTNAGKSTFLNAIMGAKIAIVSDKPQTTRRRILGVHTTPAGQIVFFDSPGIHQPHFRLNDRMMKDVRESLDDADLILVFVEVDAHGHDDIILSMLAGIKKPVFLVINKIDRKPKAEILPTIALFKDQYPWKEIVPISAKNGDNLDTLEALINQYLPIGEHFFPEDHLTNLSERFYVAEMVREKILARVRDELPFTVTVRVTDMEDRGEMRSIRAEILVETPSQKKIIIGRRGSMLRDIGEAARLDLEDYLDRRVYLDLFVKVVPGWRNENEVIREIFE